MAQEARIKFLERFQISESHACLVNFPVGGALEAGTCSEFSDGFRLRTVRRLENLRYGRLESLRYVAPLRRRPLTPLLAGA